jgi:LPXTG-motif cell wall-anchored protein
MENEVVSEVTYPARVVVIDYSLIGVGLLGALLLVALVAIIWRRRKRHRRTEK